MAARTRRVNLDESWRERIQTSMLINRLSDNALGKLEQEMSPSQVKSAEILLRKTAPDLSTVEMNGADGGPLAIQIVRFTAEGEK